MKRVTTLLTTLLILSVVALGTQAATFKLSGAYENLIEIKSTNDFEDLGALFLDNSVFSLNLNIKEKEVSIDLGLKNWTLDNFNSNPIPVSPDTADSIYLGITSPRFEGFYMQGYNPNYYYESINDPMGIGNSIDSIFRGNYGSPISYYNPISDDLFSDDLMWIGGNSLFFNYGYSYAGIYPASPLHTNYFDHLIYAKGQIGNDTGTFNFEGYYIDSKIKLLVPSEDNMASVGSYLPEEDYVESFFLSGPVIRATAEFSDYFILGATFTRMTLTNEYVYVDVDDSEQIIKNTSLYSTFNVDITGKIRFIGGEYFISGMKTWYEDSRSSSSYIDSNGIVFYAGFKDVPLGKYKQFRIGANYLSIPSDIHLFWGDSVLDEAMLVIEAGVDGAIYNRDKIRKAGASLGITLGKVDIDLTNNMYFVEGKEGIQANTTTLDVVLSNSDIAKWNFRAYNVLKTEDGVNNLTIDFDTAFKVGKYVTLGASTYNTFEMTYIYGDMKSKSNGTSSLWGYVDFVATSGIIADSKLTLGGMAGYNYGDKIETFKALASDYYPNPDQDLADVFGNFIYDAYVGINLNITNKARINGGLYVGRRLYEAYKNLDYILSIEEDGFFYSWKEPLIVGTLNAQYDISQVVTVSVTGTYRAKEYMKVKEANTLGYSYKQFDPQYYAEVAFLVKPNENSTIKVGWGFNGLSNAKLDGKANVRPWTYLKLPITSDKTEDWYKQITLDISIKF